ncbi:hypothetical protein Psfp_02336 [Pelotomaculum sp. FP]|uniref:hypothetical protein n=1 Tax=Pelotomaculum sp. FP TaxID=261474 RepID=UPI001064F071|nr:hypothetical protein [Pelotomaculum sp. FP]TEB15160.1 hypothetical protein Psfp_02336 [Pelotomaculum sp. FP]
MAKKEDPFMLENYRFLTPLKKSYIDSFFKKLDNVSREFAIKRYVEGKTISLIAEEMDYTERSLYAYREKIIELWELYSKKERLEYHKQRIVGMIRRHGVIDHSKLLMNINLKRSGLRLNEFTDIINTLIATGEVICEIMPGNRSKRRYSLTRENVINL